MIDLLISLMNTMIVIVLFGLFFYSGLITSSYLDTTKDDNRTVILVKDSSDVALLCVSVMLFACSIVVPSIIVF